jgi:hypothetical protein
MCAHAMTIPAVALLIVVIAGCQSAPGNGGAGAQSAAASSGSPARLASGTFQFPPMDAAVALNATGEGSDVTGTMTVSNDEMSFTVDLECALTTDDGKILIGGDTTDSTFAETPKGSRTAIVLKPGSPVDAVFAWQGTDARAPSCSAFLEDMGAMAVELAPIEGTVELGP